MGRLTAGMAATLLACSAAAPAAEVMVRVSGDHVDVRATSAPLADVLDRLGRQTGMKVVYEGPPPRQPVTVSLDGRSHAEAVLALLEGQGLNFVLLSDDKGTRVDTLILAGAAGTGPSPGRATAAPPVRRPFRPPPVSSPDAADTGFEDSAFGDPAFGDPAFDDFADQMADDAAPEGEPADQAVESPAPAAAPPGITAPGVPSAASPPGTTPLFPAARPSAFSASPFTPQPFPPAPPGTPGAVEAEAGAPAEGDAPVN